MDVKMKGIVRVVPYEPEWKNEFLKIKAMIVDCAGDLITGVEHVGSTAVEGLASKPIIDIDVVIDSYDVFPDVKDRLSKIGFEHEGNLGVEGREVFKRTFIDDFMPYNLYVCPKDGKGYLEHIVFRDYLRTHPEAVKVYGELKVRLAKQFRTDITAYINSKHEFVQSILKNIKK
ncbi:Glutamate-rich protein grpB [Methanosarcina barkeri str. Wiesmoor]|uniref:Glutamate-rich protein grpB n=2 Tax=Methanosarcina barkeri TaxID=2208 RepID=A0A0E3QNI1_METBA|nr:GrpB family protein [Methanosarcina barkeri]AKB51668.1 Glutamate-rich protein grpB [Methanosarcina barkeri str. Wiesmoor]